MSLSSSATGSSSVANPADESPEKTSIKVNAPGLQLPKGGGAIRGIGEKFGANPVAGTGSMTVPITTSPGRSGFGPHLSLSYDSGAGNSAFGFGWNLSLPTITRKTAKGLPRYQDAEDSDIFLLSDTEDLVPEFRKDHQGNCLCNDEQPVIHEDLRTIDKNIYRVRRYRPRVEGLFSRIERWTNTTDATDVCWRSISKDNLTTWYGKSPESRIADPNDGSRIFSWLICETHDDKGNAMVYGYKAETSDEVPRQSHEKNRTDQSRSAHRYLKYIRYGNRQPYFPVYEKNSAWPSLANAHDTDGSKAWLFETVLDYGEHQEITPLPHDDAAWPSRPDPFSSYRAGFEVRIYRLCRRVLMFHHFPDETNVGKNCLVTSTDFTYSHSEGACGSDYSFLKAVTQTGYSRNEANGYNKRRMPPVEFDYSKPVIQDRLEVVDKESLQHLPVGLDTSLYKWTDLHGEGIPGILTEQAGHWFYKRNWSPVPQPQTDGTERLQARFSPLESVSLKPNTSLSAGAELMDLAGDGLPDLVVMEGPVAGLYEHDGNEGWQPFRAFTAQLNRKLDDPNLKFIDLDGDGHADILITENDAFVWHASLAEQGFSPALRTLKTFDEEKGPHIVFADGTQSIYLADLSGDGLTDIVRIRNGEVCYWPNLGYCRFGAKITMDNSPWFDNPDQFNHQRIRLADIDGSGTTDIIYLHRDGVRLYFNQSGNRWSNAETLKVFPRVDDLTSVIPLDLLGNGTACLVWSSSLPGDASRPLRYVNLMGKDKPHLLIKTQNNLGAETRIHYAPSTKFYLQDKLAGKPWITKLPFPVHVVERVETYDHISRTRFVTRYAYHHGYFDGEEREFRGFGMVEQWDTEAFAALSGSPSCVISNSDETSNLPAVLTKTWFHTGAYHERAAISRQYAQEYFREPGLNPDAVHAQLLDDTLLPCFLTLAEKREACRALKGSMLRQEIYAEDANYPDATPQQIQRASVPYKVTEQNFAIRLLQPRGANRYAVFFAHTNEALHYHYERHASDPRIQHALTLEVDRYGNVLKQAAINYGRRQSPLLESWDRQQQTTPRLTFSEIHFTNAIDLPDAYRPPLPCETVTFELTGYEASGPAGRYSANDFVQPDKAGRLRHRFSAEVSYEAEAVDGLCRRPIEWQRTLFRRNDLTGLLPLGELQSLALPGETYQLALTKGLIDQVFQRPRKGQAAESLLPDPVALLGGQAGDQGGYVQSQTLKSDGRFPSSDEDDYWWVPSGRTFYSAHPEQDAAIELAEAQQHFFLARSYRDAFGQYSTVSFDTHRLLMTQTCDALDNRVVVDAMDYRVLQARLIRDPNGNQTEVIFDTLGMVVGTAVMGKPLPAPVEGDSLEGFVADLTREEIDTLFSATDPSAQAAALLGKATTRIIYDLDRYRRTLQAHPHEPAKWQPACTATLSRETHASAPLPTHGLKIQIGIAYSDGAGREIQKKIQAEPGPVPQRDTRGHILTNEDGFPIMTLEAVGQRWVGSGWTVFNNKGKPVRQFEPFFTDSHHFEFDVRIGISPVLFYDPLGRLVATLHPNHTYEKAVFDAWQQTLWDANDTCAPRNAQTGDPRTDPDIAGYVHSYFKAQPCTWQTWYSQRIDGALGVAERNAALRAQDHADTPTKAHFDALGRHFLTIAHNRIVCPGHDLHGRDEELTSRTEFDIEGNARRLRDAAQQADDPLGRVVAGYAYDMLGNRLYQLSMEAGARWTLNDMAGKTICAWDSRGHHFTTTYDVLRRPVAQYVRGTGEESDPRTLNRELMVEKIEYGETLENAPALNLRTRVYRHFDAAGVAINAAFDAQGQPIESHDFKGNLLRSTRRLLRDYTALPDWGQNPVLDEEAFEGRTRYDAFNRPIQSVAPRSNLARGTFNIIQPVFNLANLLERVDVWLAQATEPTALLNAANDKPSFVGVANIDYDAKGRRQRIDYKNGSSTFYDYDPLSFRLRALRTTRHPKKFSTDDISPVAEWPGKWLQNLCYVYDAVGNISHIQDLAQQAIYFRNKRVDPSSDYVYDALYHLIQASGREHLGQGGTPIVPSSTDSRHIGHVDADKPGRFAPHDGKAMGRYIERYVYDAVGNFLQMQHRGSDTVNAGWTRAYAYTDPSQIDDGQDGGLHRFNNRLTRTTLSPATDGAHSESYRYDHHGNLLHLPTLGTADKNLHWNYRDQLHQVDLSGEGAFYVYDASGQRVRKVWQKAPGLTEERIYLGSFEIFRQYNGPVDLNNLALERETLHIADDKQRIAVVETRTLDTKTKDPCAAQQIRYQLSNHLGSAAIELDAKGALISYEEYYPFGATAYQAGRSAVEVSQKRYRFSGRERDEETGLYYHGARYLAPWLGRWISADPAGLVDGANLYRYARNAPNQRIDNQGTDSSFFDEIENAIDNATSGAYRRYKAKLNIDEIDAVKGDKAGGVAGSPSDPANKQFLDNKTNSTTKSNFVGPEPSRRPPVSFADNADEAAKRMLTGPFDEITEVAAHADDATKAVTPGMRTNSSLWGRIRANPVITRAMGAIGVDLESGHLVNPSSVDQFPQGKSVHLTPMDADVDPRTGRVVEGPHTDAARMRRHLREAADVGEEVVERSGKAARVLGKLGKAGRHFVAAVPVLGIVLGQASAAHAASQGDYQSAVLDEVGFIPIVGDIVDAFRGGLALGEAAIEVLPIEEAAMRTGTQFENAAKFLGADEDTARVVGAGGAAVGAVSEFVQWTNPITAPYKIISSLF